MNLDFRHSVFRSHIWMELDWYLSFEPEKLSAGIALVLLLDLLFGMMQIIVLLQVSLLRKTSATDLTNIRFLA